MCSVLIVDDDKDLCRLIEKNLLRDKIKSDYCYSGKEAIRMLKTKSYDLVILDIVMPGIDGFETLEIIREKSDIPVLMLTSKDSNSLKVFGLREGADDYLIKPFNMEELLARVISLVRRYIDFGYKNKNLSKIKFDGLTIDINSRSIESKNGNFQLPPKEFDVLLYLIKNKGIIVTKKMIYEHVWKKEYFYDDSNIMSIISRLRKKIEKNRSNPVYIQTVKGVGYRFNKDV